MLKQLKKVANAIVADKKSLEGAVIATLAVITGVTAIVTLIMICTNQF